MTVKRGDLAIIHTVSRVAVNGGSDYDSHDYRLHVVTSITRDGAVKAVRELHRPDSTPQPVARMGRHTMVTVPASVCDLAALAQHVRTVRERTADAGYTYIPHHDSPVELWRDLAPHVSDASVIATVRAAAVMHVRESIDFVRADCARCGVRMGDGAGTVAEDSDGCPVAVCRECPHGVNFRTAYPVGLEVTVARGFAQDQTTRIERVIDHVTGGYYAGRSYVVTLAGYGARTLTEECFVPLHVPAERYAVTLETAQPVEDSAAPVEAQPVTDGGETAQPVEWDFDAAQRSYRLNERARKAVTSRRWTDKPGGRWHLSEVDTPYYCGAYAKASIYTTDDGSAYLVYLFAFHDGSELARVTVKGLDTAFRTGERLADNPPAAQPVEVAQPVAPVEVAPVETSREVAQPATVAQPVEATDDGGEVDMPALAAKLAAIGFDLAADGTVTDTGAMVDKRGGDKRGPLTYGDHADLLTALGDKQGAEMMRASGALELRAPDKKTREIPPRTAAQNARLRKAIPAGVRGPAIAAIGDGATAAPGAGTVETVSLATVPADGATVEVDGRRGRVLRSGARVAVKGGGMLAPVTVFFPADGGASLPAPVETSRQVAQPVSSRPVAPVAVADAGAGDTVVCPAPACGRRARVTVRKTYPTHRAAGNDCVMSGQSITAPAPAPRAAFSRPAAPAQPDPAPVTPATVEAAPAPVAQPVETQPVPVPDSIGPGVWVLTGGGTFGRVQRSGRQGRADGWFIFDGGAYSRFADGRSVRLAVVGGNVCRSPRFACQCGLAHAPADILAKLPTIPADVPAQPADAPAVDTPAPVEAQPDATPAQPVSLADIAAASDGRVIVATVGADGTRPVEAPTVAQPADIMRRAVDAYAAGDLAGALAAVREGERIDPYYRHAGTYGETSGWADVRAMVESDPAPKVPAAPAPVTRDEPHTYRPDPRSRKDSRNRWRCKCGATYDARRIHLTPRQLAEYRAQRERETAAGTPTVAAGVLLLEHTTDGGTVLHGTRKGDGSAPVMGRAGQGWGFSRNIGPEGAWYVPRSRGRVADWETLRKVDRAAVALAAAGFRVAVVVNGEPREVDGVPVETVTVETAAQPDTAPARDLAAVEASADPAPAQPVEAPAQPAADPAPAVVAGFTRLSISEQIRRAAEMLGLPAECRTVDGALRWIVDGRSMTPGDAADYLLDGGAGPILGRAAVVLNPARVAEREAAQSAADGGATAQPVEVPTADDSQPVAAAPETSREVARPVEVETEPGVTYEAAWAPADGTVTVVRNVRAGICGPFGDYPADSREAAAAVLAADGYAVTGEWSVSRLGEHYAPLARMARPVVDFPHPAPYWAPGYGPADGGETSQPVAGAAAPETAQPVAPETSRELAPMEAPTAQPESSQRVEWLTVAETAALIREALADAFPAVRFSVRSSRGSAVNVYWAEGPTERDVREVTDCFRGADFDGMQDMTVYRDAVTLPDGRRVKFGARFVFLHRTWTEVEETTAAPAAQPVAPAAVEAAPVEAQPVESVPAPAQPVPAAPAPAAPAPVADSRDYPHAAILRELAGRPLAGRVKVSRVNGVWCYRAELRDGGEVTGRAVWSDESARWDVIAVYRAWSFVAPAQPVTAQPVPVARELAQPETSPTVPDTAAAVVDGWAADDMPVPVSPAPAPVAPVVPSRVAAALARVTSRPVPAPTVARVAQPVAVAPAPTVAPVPASAPVVVPVAVAPTGDRGRYAYAAGTRVRATLREVRQGIAAAARAPENAPVFAGVVWTVEADRPTVAQPVGAVVVSVEAPAGVDLAAVWAVVDSIAAQHVPAREVAAV